METVKKYEKPAMRFVSLRSEETIADTCWGYHGTGTDLYFDTDGTGYCSFQIAEGPCALNLINVYYYDKYGDDSPEALSPGDARYEALNQALINAGGNGGTSFKGQKDIIFENPSENWS